MQKYTLFLKIAQKFKKNFYFCIDFDFNIIFIISMRKNIYFNNRKITKNAFELFI